MYCAYSVLNAVLKPKILRGRHYCYLHMLQMGKLRHTVTKEPPPPGHTASKAQTQYLRPGAQLLWECTLQAPITRRVVIPAAFIGADTCFVEGKDGKEEGGGGQGGRQQRNQHSASLLVTYNQVQFKDFWRFQ